MSPLETAPRATRTRLTPVASHLWQVDVVRNLTFACVIAVHATATVAAPQSVSAGAALILLHFTREVFFLITGFVLIHSYGGRPFPLAKFYRRRLMLVGVPYVLWSTIYFFVNNPLAWGQGGWERQLGTALLTGTACYHLYFLLVSLQVYLVLPLLLALLRRTEGRHGPLLAATLAFQLLETAVLQYGGPFTGFLAGWQRHADVLLTTYLGYIVAGALAAWHLARWQQWVRMHTTTVLLTLVGSAGLTLVVFALTQGGSGGPLHAQAVLQPVMLPWSLAVGLALYALGSWWALRRDRSRLKKIVVVGSHISFGVYLVHPLVMRLLFLDAPELPTLVATLLLLVLTVLISIIIVLAVQRTPLSLPLTGRERSRRQRSA